jgi:hypothetical protein
MEINLACILLFLLGLLIGGGIGYWNIHRDEVIVKNTNV